MLNDIDFEPVYTSGEHEPAEFFLDALVNAIPLIWDWVTLAPVDSGH